MQLFYSLNLSSANWARVNERLRGHLTVRALVSLLSVRLSSGDGLKHGAELMPNNRETSVELWETRRSFYSETSELLPNLELFVSLCGHSRGWQTAENLNLETRRHSGIKVSMSCRFLKAFKSNQRKVQTLNTKSFTLNKKSKNSRDFSQTWNFSNWAASPQRRCSALFVFTRDFLSTFNY